MDLPIQAFDPQEYLKNLSGHYAVDSAGHRLLQHMIQNKINDIGDTQFRVKAGKRFLDRHGEIRAASIDLDIRDRAVRTVLVNRLNTDQLEKLHDLERSLGRFLVVPSIIAKFRMEHIRYFDDYQIGEIIKFQNRTRPERKKFDNYFVPPYFEPDYEFDGMEYHHQIDELVQFPSLVVPESTRDKARSASRTFM